jgi:AAA15 family ATPase/GTPase
MLIRATFSNLYSFDKAQTISFVAGKGRTLHHHMVRRKNRNEPSLLKAAIVYGANASGKSNIVKCFDLAQKLIVKGSHIDEQILRVPFRLRKDADKEPSWFEFELELDGEMYAYKLVFNDSVILEESLIRILPTTERALFMRKWSWNEGKPNIDFGDSFSNKEENQRFQFIAQNTRSNQPFLTETVESNSDRYRRIYDWFKYGLVIIYPEAIFSELGPTLRSENKLVSLYNNFFTNLGLGISSIKEEPVDIENAGRVFPKELLDTLKKSLKNSTSIPLTSFDKSRYRLVKDKDGNLELYKIIITHEVADTHEQSPFDLKDESDGTVRLIDLIPALADVCEHERLYVIDELDRSMHAQLTRAFLEYFFSCSTSRSQILATTHELDLLDLELLRKDEIWFVEKDRNAASNLYSLEEFKPRYDKDIRRGYLQGRFGGIPIIHNRGKLGWGT